MRIHVDKLSREFTFEPQTHYDLAMLEQLAELFDYQYVKDPPKTVVLKFTEGESLCSKARTVHLLADKSTTRQVGSRGVSMPRGRKRKDASSETLPTED